MAVVERPLIALSALLALRSLIDTQPDDGDPDDSLPSEASSPGGAIGEPTTPGISSLGQAQSAAASAGSAGALSRVAQPDAAPHRERRNPYRTGER